MLHQGRGKTRVTNAHRWKSGWDGPFREHEPAMAGRSFEEDLVLFERQVREEAGERAGRPSGLDPRATLPA